MINYNKLLDFFKNIFDVVIFLFVMNSVIIISSLLGIVIFGIGPAILAAYIIIRKWFEGEKNYYVYKFFKEYRKNFLKGNFYSFTSIAMILCLYNLSKVVEYYILNGFNILVLIALVLLYVILLFLSYSFIIYFPLINTSFCIKLRHLSYIAFFMIMYAPLNTFKIFIFILVWVSIVLELPMIIPTMFFSIMILITTSQSNKILEKLELQIKSKEDKNEYKKYFR